MLKCPHCGARVKGPDLLTGVCSSCQQRLSVSVDLSGGPGGSANDETISSDVLDSGAVGSSLESGAAAAPSDSSVADVLSHEFGGGIDAARVVPAVGGPRDHDTDSHVAPTSDADEGGRTILSDQWSAADSADGGATGASADSAQTAALTPATLPAEGGGDRTFVTDELPPVDAEAGLKTLNMDAGADDQEAGLQTIGADAAALAAAADQTFVADLSGESAGDKTLVTDSESDLSGGEDRTFVSDDVPEAIVRTIQSQWADAEPAAKAGATLRGREVERTKSPKSTLIIKTRTLRDIQLTPPGGRAAEPEYELLKVLGEGGMGVVYDARQTSIDRNVALKMIKGNAAGNEKQRQKFLAEAVVTGDLDHPNIVPIYDVGRNDEGHLFYSMKRVEGTPWDKVIGTRSLAENLETLMKVADAVAFAHARGVVHRDLKPENTMLGGFGEVLVMDWGLAHPSKGFRKSAAITETSSMGGTPAYMAPEMATGPLEKISILSDVYLLGAILYEILTGKPPHQGKNAMKCLMAAARNEIAPTDKSGELIDVALKAMATNPQDRYPSVQEFQRAIRDYQSHSESVLLSTRAEEDLAAARKSDDYQEYSKALFGFQEAYELWSNNKRALAGVAQTQLAYADSARRKGDFDLGLSLLTCDDAEHRALRQQLLADKQEREARKHRLAALKRMASGLALAVFATVTVAFFWIWHEADRAHKAEIVATNQKDAADQARDQETVAKQQAVAAKDLAVRRQQEAEQARAQEAEAKQQAVLAKDLAVEKQLEAEEARKQEEIAKRKEEYEAYIARIGLAAAKIEENAFETARELLVGCKPELRNWEWGRLMHLCSQNTRAFPAHAPVDALAVSAAGDLFATGGWDGAARVWDRQTGEVRHTLATGGVYVHAVAFSPDGRFLATGGDSPQGFVQLWDVASGQRLKTLSGHEDGVLSVAFSQDGRRLLTASYDKTARLWDVASGRELHSFRGHTWWVWQAAFSPDERRVVTASQDGTAIVWDAESGRRTPPFTGHRGPVYCAAFLRDGKSIVTGGYDHRLLVWQPEEVRPYDFKNLERGAPIVAAAKFREFAGHAASVRSVGVSDDGQLLLSGSQDNTLRLWSVESGEILKTFRGHASWVRASAFARDGRTLLSASHDATVREWSIAGYEELRALQGRRLAGHADAVLAASFSPDQKSVVTASRDRTARTWNALTGAELLTLEEGHAFLASTAVFFDGGRKLLTAAVDNTARTWDVATGTQLARFDRTGRSAAAALSHNEKWLVTGGNERAAQLWDLAKGQRLRTFGEHHAEVTAVAISPDDRWLATGDAKGRARLWNIETGELVHRLDVHTRRIAAIAFADGGRRVLTASSDNTVAQWDAATGRELRDESLKHPDSVLALALTPDGGRAVTSCADRLVRVWNLADRKVEQTFGPFPGLTYALSVSAGGERLLTAHAEDRVVRLWDLQTGRELQAPAPDGALGPLVDLKRTGGLLWAAAFAPGDDVLTVGGSDARLWDVKTGRERMSFSPHGAVASAHFSQDGRWIVTGSWDNSAKIWDAATGRAVRKLEGGHEGFVNTACFSPDSRYVLTASDDGTAKLWNAETGEVVRTFAGHEDRVRFAAFSRRGDLVVTTSNDKTARLWNTETGASLRVFRGHAWAVLCADFSADGARLITGSEDNAAKLWNVATGDCELTLAGHTASVASVAFAPDGARVLTGSQDQAAKLWDARTGKEILTLNRHTEDVTSVSFSPDGRQILTGSRDGTAVIWLSVDWRVPQPAAPADQQTAASSHRPLP